MKQHLLEIPLPTARATDYWTSHVAAEQAQKFQAGHIGIILAALQDAGREGMTIDEIAKRCPLTSVQIARRLPECERMGLAYPSGHTRLSASGRPERVWVVS